MTKKGNLWQAVLILRHFRNIKLIHVVLILNVDNIFHGSTLR